MRGIQTTDWQDVGSNQPTRQLEGEVYRQPIGKTKEADSQLAKRKENRQPIGKIKEADRQLASRKERQRGK